MSLPHVLNKELWITIALLIDDKFSEFKALRWNLVRSNNGVVS